MLNLLVADLVSNNTVFAADLSALKSDIENLYNNCTSNEGCSSKGFDPTNISNPASLIARRNFTDVLASGTFPRNNSRAATIALTAIIDNGLVSGAKDGQKQFEEIPELVQNETERSIGNLTERFDEFKHDIDDGVDPFIDELRIASAEVESIHSKINDIAEYIEKYNPHRKHVLTALTSVVLAIVCFNALGITFGIVDYDKDVSPTQRGWLSNCGGLMLMSAVGLAFIFAVFYMLLTSVTFIVGAPIHKFICKPIQSEEIFENTIDIPDAVPGIAGFYLGDLLYDDGNVSLTVSGALDGCENNLTVYTVFKVEHIANASKFLDFVNFNVEAEFDDLKVNISHPVKILSNATRSNLEKAREVGASDINWTAFNNELDFSLIDYGEDLHEFATSLQTFIDEHTGTPVFPGDYETLFTEMVANISAFQTSSVNPIVSLRNKVSAILTQVKNGSTTINSFVDPIIAESEAANNYISNNLDAFLFNQLVVFEDRVTDYIRQFIEYAEDMIYNEIGRCRPVYNLIQNLKNTFCRSVLDAFNGTWLCLGWIVIFLIPSIVFGVKLSKFFRRMNEEDVYDDGIEMKTPSYNHGAPPIRAYRNNMDPTST